MVKLVVFALFVVFVVVGFTSLLIGLVSLVR